MASAAQDVTDHSLNCRNRQTERVGKDKPPFCIDHPGGSLRYEFHSAYDQIDKEKDTRKQIASILLRGAFEKPRYNKISEFLLKEFDNNPDTYTVNDITAIENAQAFDAAKVVLVGTVGDAINNTDFEMDDLPHYMNSAIKTFIRDTHKRLATASNAPANPTSRGVRRPQPDTAEDSDDDVQVTSIRAKRPRHTQYPPARTSTVIDIDAPAINNPAIGDSLLNIGALSADLSAAVTFHSEVVQTEVTDLEARVAELEARNGRLQNSNNLLRTQASGATTALQQAGSDIATLGAALCERSNLRRNSQTAILNELPLRNHLSADLMDRLVRNEKFREKWQL